MVVAARDDPSRTAYGCEGDIVLGPLRGGSLRKAAASPSGMTASGNGDRDCPPGPLGSNDYANGSYSGFFQI